MAASILDGVSHEFKVTWNEPQPGLGLGTMIITIFTFIGIALAFTTIAGVSYGGLRVFVKWRYGNRLFDRPETMELTTPTPLLKFTGIKELDPAILVGSSILFLFATIAHP